MVVGCKTSVIPADGSVKKIGDRAFWGSGITNLVIPDGVTEIGEMTFAACNELLSVEIPTSVKTIHGLAFAACNNLVIVYKGTIQQWEDIKKDYAGIRLTVECTDGELYWFG